MKNWFDDLPDETVVKVMTHRAFYPDDLIGAAEHLYPAMRWYTWVANGFGSVVCRCSLCGSEVKEIQSGLLDHVRLHLLEVEALCEWRSKR